MLEMIVVNSYLQICFDCRMWGRGYGCRNARLSRSFSTEMPWASSCGSLDAALCNLATERG